MKDLKVVAVAMAACALLSGCSKDEEMNVSNETKAITFQVDDLLAQKTPMTRAALADASITSVEIYDGTTLVKSQASTDEDFGSPTLDLTYGSHTLYFIAHRCDGARYADGVWSATKVKDTFMKKVELTVSTSTASSQSVELDRKVYELVFSIQDAVPTDCATAEYTIGTYYNGVKLADFSGTGETSYSSSVDVTSVQGKSGVTIKVFGFGAEDGVEYTSSVSVTFKKSDGTTIQSHTKSDVPLQTNYITTIKGNYFAAAPGWSVTVSNEWTGEKEVEL